MADQNDEIFDALLKVGVGEAIRLDIESMPSTDELNKLYSPSDEMDARVKKLIKDYKSKQKRKSQLRSLCKVAASIVVFFSVAATVLFSVDASRNYILNLFVEVRDDHIDFEFDEGSGETSDSSYILSYVPDGFELSSSHDMDGSLVVTYVSGDGMQLLFTHDNAGTLKYSIDGEDADFSLIKDGGYDFYFLEAPDDSKSNTLTWEVEENFYSVTSELDVSELIKVAKGIEVITE